MEQKGKAVVSRQVNIGEVVQSKHPRKYTGWKGDAQEVRGQEQGIENEEEKGVSQCSLPLQPG